MNLNRLLALNNFPEYVIEIGVFAEKADRMKVGLNNAEIMFINENGSPTRNIPERPVLQMTIDWAYNSGLVEKTLDKCLEMYLDGDSIDKIDNYVKKFALRLQKYARDLIKSNDGRLKANAPSTIKQKGENYPLHDTGQLTRSITCISKRIKGGNKNDE